MNRTRTSHRGEKDDNGFTAKGRVIKLFLENQDITPEEAFRQAGLVEHKLSSVRGWLRNSKYLLDAGLERYDNKGITVPEEVQQMWRNALRQRRAHDKS